MKIRELELEEAELSLESLEEKLNIKFKNKILFLEAFTHQSYLNENPRWREIGDYERLEFLGDGVLGLATKEFLFKTFRDSGGNLTSRLASLVNIKTLAFLGKKLGLEEYIRFSKGEAEGERKSRERILGQVVEAFLAALYLDQGYSVVQKLLAKHLFPELSSISEKEIYPEWKNRFQEWAQKYAKDTPTYKVLKEEGTEHFPKFTVGVFLGEMLVAKGEGSSKKEAEENAAGKAFKKAKKLKI